jgi:hypothetical protein
MGQTEILGEDELPAAMVSFASGFQEMATALAGVSANLSEQTKAITEQTALLSRVSGRLKVERLVALLLFIGLLVLAIGNRVNGESIKDTVEILESVTSPEGEIYQETQNRTDNLLLGFALEMDCRDRRRDAGLPAPVTPLLPSGAPDYASPLFSCASQTSADVFPGATP